LQPFLPAWWSSRSAFMQRPALLWCMMLQVKLLMICRLPKAIISWLGSHRTYPRPA
jgi:hypothetical protein